MSEWRVHIVDDYIRHGVRLHIYRHLNHERVQELGIVDGELTVSSFLAGEMQPDNFGIRLQYEMLEPLRLALNERLGPMVGEAEVRRLEESLEVERARVQQVIDMATAPPKTAALLDRMERQAADPSTWVESTGRRPRNPATGGDDE